MPCVELKTCCLWREVCKTRTGESEWRTEPALCREGRRAPSLHLGTPSFLPPSLPFLQNGDQTRVPRGLGHFVCILTDILRFAAKRQSIKVLPLKRKRDGDKLSAEGRLEKRSFEHPLSLLKTNWNQLFQCLNATQLSFAPGKALFLPMRTLHQQIGFSLVSWPDRPKRPQWGLSAFKTDCFHWNAKLGFTPLCTRIKNSPEWCSVLGRRQDSPWGKSSLAN